MSIFSKFRFSVGVLAISGAALVSSTGHAMSDFGLYSRVGYQVDFDTNSSKMKFGDTARYLLTDTNVKFSKISTDKTPIDSDLKYSVDSSSNRVPYEVGFRAGQFRFFIMGTPKKVLTLKSDTSIPGTKLFVAPVTLPATSPTAVNGVDSGIDVKSMIVESAYRLGACASFNTDSSMMGVKKKVEIGLCAAQNFSGGDLKFAGTTPNNKIAPTHTTLSGFAQMPLPVFSSSPFVLSARGGVNVNLINRSIFSSFKKVALSAATADKLEFKYQPVQVSIEGGFELGYNSTMSGSNDGASMNNDI